MILFYLAMNPNEARPPDPGVPAAAHGGQATDEFGLPAKPPSKPLAALVLAGVWICALASVGIVVNELIRRSFPGVLTGIGISGSALALALWAVTHTLKPKRGMLPPLGQVEEALEPVGQRVLKAGAIVASVGFLALLITINPNGRLSGG